MAKVVLEIQTRGLNQYHKIDTFPVRIGRALDNDIILSDLSVAPHHMEIDKNEQGELVVINVSETQKMLRTGNVWIDSGEQKIVDIPTELQLGHLTLRVLSEDMPVESTKVKRCRNFFCCLNNSIWTFTMFIMAVIGIIWDFSVSQVSPQTVGDYLQNTMIPVLLILFMTLVISVLNRLIMHRWEALPALGISATFFLLTKVFKHLGHWLDYFFTSSVPSDFISTTCDFLLLPALLYIFITRINNVRSLPALGYAFLFASPLLIYHLLGVADQISDLSVFNPDPEYSKTLRASDVRWEETRSLEDFLAETRRKLDGGGD